MPNGHCSFWQLLDYYIQFSQNDDIKEKRIFSKNILDIWNTLKYLSHKNLSCKYLAADSETKSTFYLNSPKNNHFSTIDQ